MGVEKRLLVRAAVESQSGNARGNNEDNVYFNGDFISPRNIRSDFAMRTGEYSENNCFAVLDGMGRNNTGSYASLLAASRLDEVSDRVAYDVGRDPDAAVLDYVNATNAAIREQIKDTGGVRTATTLALLIINNGTVRAYNVGDSRIYLFRDRQLVKLSRDHVLVDDERSFALTAQGVKNGGLTKYLGMPEDDGVPEPYRAKPFKIRSGDKFLVCSDGLTDYVSDDDIAECLAKRKDPFGHTNELISMAYRAESADNISAIVVEVVEPGLHITQNMILTFAACMIFLLGLLIGGIFGYTIAERRFNQNQFINQPQAVVTQTDVTLTSDLSGTTTLAHVTDDQSAGVTKTEHPTTTYPTTTRQPYLVETFTIYPTDFTLKVGKTQNIGVTLTPSDIPMSAVVWTSSDPEIATVDEYGMVTAVSKGTATISATIDDWTEKCIVRVRG